LGWNGILGRGNTRPSVGVKKAGFVNPRATTPDTVTIVDTTLRMRMSLCSTHMQHHT
jgi:hypothetical protein